MEEVTDDRGNLIHRKFADSSDDKDFEYRDISKSQMKTFSTNFGTVYLVYG